MKFLGFVGITMSSSNSYFDRKCLMVPIFLWGFNLKGVYFRKTFCAPSAESVLCICKRDV